MKIPFFLVFLALTALEILILIQVGSWLGALPTIGLVILAAAAGMLLLRWQGFSMARRIRETLLRGEWPANEMMAGTLVMIAGILLILPGFLSDILALLLLLPWLRRTLIGHLPGGRDADTGHGPGSGQARHQRPPYVIEGEFRREPSADKDERTHR